MCLEMQLPKSLAFEGKSDGFAISADMPAVYDLMGPGVPGTPFAQEDDRGREFAKGGEERKSSVTVEDAYKKSRKGEEVWWEKVCLSCGCCDGNHEDTCWMNANCYDHTSKRTKCWEADVYAMENPLLMENLCSSSLCPGILKDPEANGVTNTGPTDPEIPIQNHVDCFSLSVKDSPSGLDSDPKCEELCCDVPLPSHAFFDSYEVPLGDVEGEHFETLRSADASLAHFNFASLFPSEDDASVLCIGQATPEVSKCDILQPLQLKVLGNDLGPLPSRSIAFFPSRSIAPESYVNSPSELQEIQTRPPTAEKDLCFVSHKEIQECPPMINEDLGIIVQHDLTGEQSIGASIPEGPHTLVNEMDLEDELWNCDSYSTPFLRAESADSYTGSFSPFPSNVDEYLNEGPSLRNDSRIHSPSLEDRDDDCESSCSNDLSSCHELQNWINMFLPELSDGNQKLCNEAEEKDEIEGDIECVANKENWNRCQSIRVESLSY